MSTAIPTNLTLYLSLKTWMFSWFLRDPVPLCLPLCLDHLDDRLANPFMISSLHLTHGYEIKPSTMNEILKFPV